MKLSSNRCDIICRRIKHSQIVSGVKWYNFWLSTFTWDFVNFLIPALLTVCMFAWGGVENLSGKSNVVFTVNYDALNMLSRSV